MMFQLLLFLGEGHSLLTVIFRVPLWREILENPPRLFASWTLRGSKGARFGPGAPGNRHEIRGGMALKDRGFGGVQGEQDLP